MGVDFLEFAAIVAYPLHGTPSTLALLLVLAGSGVLTLGHAARLDRRARCRWIVVPWRAKTR